MSAFTLNDSRDNWMAVALRSRSERAQPRSDCPSPERIWDAVRLLVPLDERVGVIDHLSECPACAEAWTLAGQLAAAQDQTAHTEVNEAPLSEGASPISSPSGAFSGRQAWLVGAAAVTLVAVGIAFMMLRPPAPPREATESPLKAPPTEVPQPVQQTTNPVAAPAPVRPSPPAPARPTVVETPAAAAAQEQARARAEALAELRAPRPATPPDTSPLSPGESDVSAIRRVIDTYKTAIETKDVDLFRAIRPGLSAAEEARLRESFRTIDTQQLRITIDEIRLDGLTATARISRRDVLTAGGRQQVVSSQTSQTLRFEKSASGWVLTAIETLR